MSSLSRTVSFLVIAAACGIGRAAEPPARPTQDQIAQWVVQLGDDDFTVREAASRKLYEAGSPAEEALQVASHSDDAEVARRARDILVRFKWGLYADTPPDVAARINRYRDGDVNAKGVVVQELLAAGPSGYRALCKIAGAEDDPVVRGRVYQLISGEVKRVAPQMLLEEKYDVLESLLDAVLANDPQQGAEDYAAYWMMRGTLDEHIAHYKALASRGSDAEKDGEILAHLLHARGDLSGARAAADKAGKPELADALLFEAGDWKALAGRPIHSPSNVSYDILGLQATYHRLAGDARGFDDAVAQLRKDVAATPDDEYQRFYLAKVLFLNDRPVEGLDVVLSMPNQQAAAFEMLAAQMRYAEALKLADDAKEANSPDAPVLEILKARTLYSLGEKDKATAIFARYAAQLPGAGNASWPETLIDAELRVGRKEQAFEQATLILATTRDQGLTQRLIPKLFPKNVETAETLWKPLSKRTGVALAENMKDVRALLDGTVDRKLLAFLAERASVINTGGLAPYEGDIPRALAEAALAAKDEKLARSLLEQSGSAEALIRLGDLEADKKDWDKAEQCYAKAWEKNQSQVLALYLDGWAMAQAGKEKEGKRRMEIAHWAPLGDGSARAIFLKGLEEHGQREAARRERELLLRLSPAGSFFAAQAMRESAVAALGGDDHAAAAAAQERTMLRCLYRGVSFVQPSAYLSVPALVHRLRARADAEAGKFDAAQNEVNLGLAALPGDTFIPVEIVPAWDRAGRKKEAQELFDRCLTVQEKCCRDYPNCPWGHNSVAWLSACCRRNLDSAREHALKAVALAPDNAGYLDTLAEVCFQRGDQDQAVAAEKKAVHLDPKKAYYGKQLRRIEAGDPAAQRPAEDDEE